jgi:hypothetical protein
MPYTINGFGTGYVGKRNVETRRGVCAFCGHEATIRSYDAWYCVVALFVIPIAPSAAGAGHEQSRAASRPAGRARRGRH